jgi:hypothetical protein
LLEKELLLKNRFLASVQKIPNSTYPTHSTRYFLANPATPPKPDKNIYPTNLPLPLDLTNVNKRSTLLTNSPNAADPNFPYRPIFGSCL